MIWFISRIKMFGELDDKGVKQSLKRVRERCQYAGSLTFSNHSRMACAAVTSDETMQPSTLIKERLGLIIVGDVRIDNRMDVIDILRKNGKTIQDSSDLELVLLLYLQFGSDCVKWIVGEFSFVLWDERMNRIFAARDQIGMRTLFWTQQGDSLWIASDIFLLQDIFAQDKIDRQYFHSFFIEGGCVDSELTPYLEVKRVPSGHYLSNNKESTLLFSYWNLSEVTGEIRYSTEEEFCEQFRTLLKEAVRCRISPQGKTAILMSGGLDSTSIFAMAKQLEHVGDSATIPISGIFDDFLDCDEREYIKPLLEKYNTEAHYLRCDNLGILKSFPDDAPWTFEPHVPSITHGFTSSLMKFSRDAGAAHVLTGCSGDHFLSGTPGVIADLIGKCAFGSAFKQAKSLAEMTRGSLFRTIWKYGLAPHFRMGFYNEITGNRGKDFRSKIAIIPTLYQKEFYRQWTGTKNRIYMDREIGPQVGVDIQHPFMDRRLVEFLYKIPGEKLWSSGTRKVILRNALKEDLPKEIVNRRNKTVHLPVTFKGLIECWPNLYPVLQRGRITAFGWISRREWLQGLTNLRQGHGFPDDIFLFIALEIWLYRMEERLNVTAVI